MLTDNSFKSSTPPPVSQSEKALRAGSLLCSIRTACLSAQDDPNTELSFWDIYESLTVVQELLMEVVDELPDQKKSKD